jgi:hypothetical protein
MSGPMGAPPMATGPAMVPGPMAGQAAQGMTGVKLALEVLQKALPGLQMGSELHSAVMKSITDLSKHIGQGADDQSGIVQQLAMLARAAQADPARMAMMRQMGGGGAPPVPPMGGAGPMGGAPPMPGGPA